MKAYLDTSVILRILLGESNPVASWGKWTAAYSSRIWLIEARRTIDRLRLTGRIDDGQVAQLQHDINLVNNTIYISPVSDSILQRAGEAFPTVLGTLDAIHLASAAAIHKSTGIDIILTHDKQLATAACSLGFTTEGC